MMKVLTLNIWGAPYAKHRASRMRRICEQLMVLDPDVILLQEAYVPDNLSVLVDTLSPAWGYHHHFASGLVGSGLLTFSRYPIVDSAFHQFRLRGKPERLTQGDFYAAKGIGKVRVASPVGVVDVYNCHTHAQYEYWDDENEYAIFTSTNLYEAARFINAQSGDVPVVLGGDLNVRPDQLGYAIVTTLAKLTDWYPTVHGESVTTYAADNPYTKHENQVLDYVMGRGIGCEAIELVMTEHFSRGEVLAYSDHYGLLATIRLDDVVSQAEGDVAAVLTRLRDQAAVALTEAEAEEIGHYETALLATSAILDGFLLAGFIGQWFKGVAKLIRRVVPLFGLGYAVYQLAQGGLNLRGRQGVLRSTIAEIEHQLNSDETDTHK